MEILLIIAVLILAFYVYKNTRVSNYFFSISFHWSKVYELLNIPEEALKLDLAESYAESIQKFIEYKTKSIV